MLQFLVLFAWFWAAFTALDAVPRVNIAVRPSVVQEGGQLEITCHVRRHEDNRRLDMGIDDIRLSSESLAGAEASVLYHQTIYDLPCAVDGVALQPFCRVLDRYNHAFTAQSAVQVAGCESEADRR